MSTMTATVAQTPPGPSTWQTFACLSAFRSDPIGFLSGMHQRYGDTVRLPLGLPLVSVIHPDAVRHVLQENHRNYEKGQDYERLEVVVGKGLLTSNGETWKRHRRLLQPAFHRQRIAGFAKTIVEKTQLRIERWRQAGAAPVIDLHEECMALTLEIVGECLFSTDLSAETEKIGRSMGPVLRMTNDYTSALVPLPLWFPTPFFWRFRKELATLDDAVTQLIDARMQEGAAPAEDLLGMLLAAHHDSDQPGEDEVALSLKELRDEVMTLLIAGHETTASALTFTFLLLTQNPAAQARLREETAQVLAGRVAGADDLPALSYAKQVAEESMRIYPPAWVMGRRAIAADRIGNHEIAAGMHVVVSPILTHRDPRFFPEPLRFLPERFASKDAAPRGAYFPFAAGPRQCIGMGFALMELQLILSTLLQAADITVLDPDAMTLEPLITLRPRNGLRARVRFRQ